MAISIDRTTFPGQGGSFTINITKEDNSAWGITISPAAWYDIILMDAISPYLYEIQIDVDANDSGTSRSMSIGVTAGEQSELFTIVQPTRNALSADILSVSPSGNIASGGGNITVDVYANGGDDALTSGSVSGTGISLTSTTHGVTSGGVTATRFVFTWTQNTTTSPRTATLNFSVSDGLGGTATATTSKAQDAALVNQGSLSVASVSVAATDTSATSVISAADMITSSILVSTTTFNFVTDAQIDIQGGNLVLAITFPANTGAARSETIGIKGTDNYGNTLTATMTLSQGAAGATHAISASWDNDGSLTYEGGSETATIAYTGTFTGDASISYGTLPDGVTVTLTSNTQITVTYSGGNVEETVQVPITITRTGDDSETYSVNLVFTLRGGGVFPIWKDIMGTIISDDDFEDYELQEGGSLLYAGRAFAYPDESNIQVNISRVVAPYLTDYYIDVDFISDNNTLASYEFVRDYSYDPGMDYTQDQWLNRPINGLVPSGVKLSVSKWGASAGGSMQVTDEGGALAVNETMAKGLNIGEWISGSPGKTYTFGSESYTVVDMCQGALLKYVNAYGAIDFFLVEGVAKKSDSIARSSYEKDAAAMTRDFETKDYQAAMTANWTGTTGWLSDAQSLRMKHLVESVEVYMIDQATGEDIPVVMKDTQMEYKTFGNGKQLVNYTLKWTESQKKIRR